MTTGRAIEPLLNLDLCEETKVGVSKILRFKEKDELWIFFKTKIDSPIEQVAFLKRIPKRLPFSGINALSESSMLADDRIQTYCVRKKKFKEDFAMADSALEEFAGARLEVWNREPLFVKGKRINPLDCFLVLKNEDDERVKIELEKLLKKTGFKI